MATSLATTAMKAWTLDHAPRELYLPAHIPVRTMIVTHPRTTSGRASAPKTSSTFHDTGNPRTNAMGEWGWLAGGRQGGSLGGYNAIIDDGGIIYCQYLDWETWHAGVNTGNLWSWGSEFAFGGAVVWVTALENACAWHGALLEMGDLDPVAAFRWHQYWTGKYCPGQIFNRGLQGVVKDKIIAYWKMARAARTGMYVPRTPVFVSPVIPMVGGEAWDGSADITLNGVTFESQRIQAKTLGALNMRQWATTQSQFTGPGYGAGDEVELLGWVAGELVNGISEWWVDVDGNRLWAGGIDAEPKVDPDFGQNPEDTPGVIPVNGRLYYPLTDEETGEIGRKINVWRDGDLYKWADTSTEVVGEASRGEERLFRYWTRGEEIPLFDGGPSELIWFAEELHTGARMWAGLSDERPS